MNLSNFIKGFGSILNIFPPLERKIELPKNNKLKHQIIIPSHSDEEALRKDWETIGKDFYTVISKSPNHD